VNTVCLAKKNSWVQSKHQSVSKNISPNDQHLFANVVELKAQLLSLHLPHKLAQTAQFQVASLTGRLLYNFLLDEYTCRRFAISKFFSSSKKIKVETNYN